MSDELEPSAPAAPAPWEDSVKQLKSELHRKTKETSELVSQLINSQAQLQQAITQMGKPQKTEAEDKSLETLMYDNPTKYAQVIKEQAKREALDEMRRETDSKSSIDNTVRQLAAEYPELSDQEHDLTKNAVEILKHIPDTEKTPRSYEFAVLKAAGALDIKPRSKRVQSEDDFVAPSYSSPHSRSKKTSTEKVVNDNKAIAAQFGLNLDDPKTKAQYVDLINKKRG